MKKRPEWKAGEKLKHWMKRVRKWRKNPFRK